MAVIGKWGDIVKFEVNSDKVLTFSDLKRDAGGRWAEHNIILGKPRKEYKGPKSQNITMKISLDARHGVNPSEEMEKIRAASQNGTVAYLFIGGRKICANRVYAESVSESWDEIWNQGELIRASISVTFSEYK